MLLDISETVAENTTSRIIGLTHIFPGPSASDWRKKISNLDRGDQIPPASLDLLAPRCGASHNAFDPV